MNIIYSAPIAIPFSGDIAALYGKPVLTGASSYRVWCRLDDQSDQQAAIGSMIQAEVLSYLKKRQVEVQKGLVNCQFRSTFPSVEYDGYRAACIVTAVAAFCERFTGTQFQAQEINSLAYKIEKKLYQQALGYFTSTSTFGGLQFFRKEFEFLKSIAKLQFKLSKAIEDKLCIVNNSGIKVVQNVSAVRMLYNQKSDEVEKLFGTIEKVTKRLVVAAAKEDTTFFIRALQEKEQILQAISNLSAGAISYPFHSIEIAVKESTPNSDLAFELSDDGLRRE